MPTLPLEDTFADILGKAAGGQRITREQLAARTNTDLGKLKALFAGDFEESTLRQIAPTLGLSADALVAAGRKAWAPEPFNLEGLAQFSSPFDESSVNAYLIWDPTSREAVIFDSGTDAAEMLEFIHIEKLKVVAILLTHTHGDHIFELDRLKSRTSAPAFVGDREPIEGAEVFHEGRAFSCGSLKIDSRLTWGHSKGGITYVVQGLARTVAIVGDAVFAGSMGGGAVSYPDALATNKSEIFTLPEETIICPGHGPLTTVGEERQHNPFYAEPK